MEARRCLGTGLRTKDSVVAGSLFSRFLLLVVPAKLALSNMALDLLDAVLLAANEADEGFWLALT